MWSAVALEEGRSLRNQVIRAKYFFPIASKDSKVKLLLRLFAWGTDGGVCRACASVAYVALLRDRESTTP